MHDAHDALAEVSAILGRSKEALGQFQAILEPTIEQAADDHERLYWHHIYEEEEHRFDRLAALLPKLEEALADEAFLSRENGDFLRLLQDISLEKFGLHNFLEHLDLSLFHYKGTEHEPAIAAMRDMTAADYQQMKAALETLNRALDAPLSFDASVPTDEKEHQKDHLKLAQYAVPPSDPAPVRPSIGTRRQLTVGSLKHG
ncbi:MULTISPECIES: IMEF encapsulin system ferritin-like cargo protein [Geobacillus]|uniref:IMEF encapsulin system ferritin-like cargo protein n=1 Tax=Geobacillus TaxID=129337 RepID=UPI000B1E02C6|nr:MULTISPECIES: IMEF encapsulin system ferritin-like cargo protein [Geobacillus]